MAVPKRKQSKERTNTRFAHFKANAPTLAECPNCHELKRSHRICKACGYYDGRLVVEKKEKKAD